MSARGILLEPVTFGELKAGELFSEKEPGQILQAWGNGFAFDVMVRTGNQATRAELIDLRLTRIRLVDGTIRGARNTDADAHLATRGRS